jgi:hypothetical protein
MSSLKNALEQLTGRLTAAAVAASEAAVAELLGELRGATIADIGELIGGSPRPTRAVSARKSEGRKLTKKRRGRLPRRSIDEIMAAVDDVVRLLRKHKMGLRAEDIRVDLSLDKREVPRVLRTAMGAGAIRILSGQKRSTTYGIGGAKKSAKPRKAKAASPKLKAKTAPKKRTAKTTSKKTRKVAPHRAAAKRPKRKAKAHTKPEPEATANGIATPATT